MAAIKQKTFNNIEIKEGISFNGILLSISNKEGDTDSIPIERENIPALISALLPENKEVRSAEEIWKKHYFNRYGTNVDNFVSDWELEAMHEFHNQFISQPVQNTLTAVQILDEEIDSYFKEIMEQNDIPKELRTYKKFILDAMERYGNQPVLPPKEGAEDIVKALADWSIKYPRNVTYSMSQKKMDDELIAIEERAKKYFSSFLPTNKQQ